MIRDFFLRGRTGHPLLPELKQYRYAHRGYHDKPQIPENSLPAFRRAIERGWGAELDVHLLKDGTLAVFHDSDLKRCTGEEGTIEDLDLAQLKQLRLEGTQEQVPLFDEVLALFEETKPLIIELKTYKGNHRALAEAVCRRFGAAGLCLEDEVLPLAACGRFLGGEFRDIHIVTKGGSQGDRTAAEKCIAYLLEALDS